MSLKREENIVDVIAFVLLLHKREKSISILARKGKEDALEMGNF